MTKTKNVLITAFFIFIALHFSIMHGQTNEKSTAVGYAEATYSGLSDNVFMQNWMVLGPLKIDKTVVKPDENKQKEAFEKDLLTSVAVQPKKSLASVKLGDSTYTWKPVKFQNGAINLGEIFNQIDYSIAYALAEIKIDNPEKVLVGVGSDDAIKIFLNGELVHSNMIVRSLKPDEDIVALDLKKGSNQILVKVQNMEMYWGFCIRKLGKNTLNTNLIEAVGSGILDNVKTLISYGADINATNDLGLTAYQYSMIKGRDQIMDFLKENGAKTDIPLPSFDVLVDNIFKSTQKGITPGVAVLVSQNGKIIYEKSFGYADVGNKVPVTSDTKFRIGSITKQFIASSILKLQEEGKLSVTDKLSKFIPDFPHGTK